MTKSSKTSTGAADRLALLKQQASSCTRCDLYKSATQTVFGEGPAMARIVLIGEQPGNSEDLQGRPFVGPAGHLLDECLAEVGLDRAQVYVTNAVKHFKWQPRGKLRIHKKPSWRESQACKDWLDDELAVLRPEVIVCLGATAAQALMGRAFRITRDRGKAIRLPDMPAIVATTHPSAILRISEKVERDAAMLDFVRDLREAVKLLSPGWREKSA